MANGIVVGIVEDNVDPNGMNRVLVRFPVESGDGLSSSWCRMMMPMGGLNRGMVMLPDIGTEVILGFAYRSLSPYVIGGVYNGAEDKPEPYKNDDGNNDKRVFWSRNDHMVIFDDTSGAEKVEIGAQVPTRLSIATGPIYQSLDSVEKTLTEYSDKDTIWEAKETVSFKCKDFKLEASGTIAIGAKMAILKSGQQTKIESKANQIYNGQATQINSANEVPDPSPVLPTPEHKHPPTS